MLETENDDDDDDDATRDAYTFITTLGRKHAGVPGAHARVWLFTRRIDSDL